MERRSNQKSSISQLYEAASTCVVVKQTQITHRTNHLSRFQAHSNNNKPCNQYLPSIPSSSIQPLLILPYLL